MRHDFRRTIAVLAAMFLSGGCAEYGPHKNYPPSRAEVAWVNGKPEGPAIVYAGCGHVAARGAFHNGLKEGAWTFYVSTDQKVVEVSYNNGLKDGLCQMWYGPFIDKGRYAGNLKLELPFQKGQASGEKQSWYPGGEKGSVVEFKKGRIIAARVWNQSGEELPPSKAMLVAEDQWRADLKFFGQLDEAVEEGLRNSGARLSRQ